MGIHYLSGFVNKHFKGWKRSLVKGKLIIDGHSLSYALFEEYSNGSQSEIYGGDYVTCARQMDGFFNTLLEAGIKPVVVIDGINPDNKADTIAERNKIKLETVVSLFYDIEALPVEMTKELESDKHRVREKRSTERKHARPFLLLDVLINSVKRVLGDDHLFVADSDADVDIACLAIHHQCPVLSQDSDFCVFPLLYGYIPYSKFHWRNAKNHIFGELYYYELFCQQFGIRDTLLLTVIPAILGNDTITQMDEPLLKMIMPPGDSYTGNLVESAVKFVANFTTFDNCLTWLRQQKLFGMIKSVQDVFHDYLFLPLFKPRNSSTTSIRCKDGSCLPDLLLKKYRKGAFYSFVIDAVQTQKVRFSVVVEDVLSESWCRLIGVPIRKAIYGILCGSDACILESQRCANATSQVEVEITSIIHVMYDGEEVPLPTLQSCGSELDVEYGKKILFGILDARKEDFNDTPEDYQLLLAITRYWYKHCTIEKKEVLLKSFVLLLQFSRENKLERYRSIGGRLARYTEPPFRMASFAHAFAQWKTLYHDIKSLNALLQTPLKLLLVSDFLECSCLYSLTEAVVKGDLKIIEEYHLNENAYQVFFAVTYTKE